MSMSDIKLLVVNCARSLPGGGVLPVLSEQTHQDAGSFPGGGTVDFFARAVAPKLSDAIGQQAETSLPKPSLKRRPMATPC